MVLKVGMPVKYRRSIKMIRTILVPLTTELSSEAFLDAALLVAKRLNSHIRVLFIQPNPDTAFAYLPDVILAAGVTREVIERETQGGAARRSSSARSCLSPSPTTS